MDYHLLDRKDVFCIVGLDLTKVCAPLYLRRVFNGGEGTSPNPDGNI